MSLASDAIFSEALKLPETERLILVSRLLETMPTDDSVLSLDDASLNEELDRRFADSAGGVPWSELRSEGSCRPPK
jgi:putative addiction module component (TIGR02574 family)